MAAARSVLPLAVLMPTAGSNANWASCHGAQLEGQPDWQRRRPDGRLPAPPHDETGHTRHHATLLRLVLQGPAAFAGAAYATDMPAFEGVLPAEDVRAVPAFVMSAWPPDIRARQAAVDTAAPRRATKSGQ
jgi:hypothetical protein